MHNYSFHIDRCGQQWAYLTQWYIWVLLRNLCYEVFLSLFWMILSILLDSLVNVKSLQWKKCLLATSSKLSFLFGPWSWMYPLVFSINLFLFVDIYNCMKYTQGFRKLLIFLYNSHLHYLNQLLMVLMSSISFSFISWLFLKLI